MKHRGKKKKQYNNRWNPVKDKLVFLKSYKECRRMLQRELRDTEERKYVEFSRITSWSYIFFISFLILCLREMHNFFSSTFFLRIIFSFKTQLRYKFSIAIWQLMYKTLLLLSEKENYERLYVSWFFMFILIKSFRWGEFLSLSSFFHVTKHFSLSDSRCESMQNEESLAELIRLLRCLLILC